MGSRGSRAGGGGAAPVPVSGLAAAVGYVESQPGGISASTRQAIGVHPFKLHDGLIIGQPLETASGARIWSVIDARGAVIGDIVKEPGAKPYVRVGNLVGRASQRTYPGVTQAASGIGKAWDRQQVKNRRLAPNPDEGARRFPTTTRFTQVRGLASTQYQR